MPRMLVPLAAGPGVPNPTAHGVVLWVLLALFVGRVVGQVIVVLWAPGWLPPMRQWYSGLLPYRFLLPIQVLFIAAMAIMALDVSTGGDVLGGPYRRLGDGLVIFSYVYAGAMVVRYVVRMARRPDQRWFGGTIPIVFHIVLAAFLYTFGRFQAG